MKSNDQKSKILVTSLIALSMTCANAFAAKTTLRLPKEDPNAFTLEMAKAQAQTDGGVTAVRIAQEQIDEAKGALDSAHGLRKPTFTANLGIGAQNVRDGNSGGMGTHSLGITIPLLNNPITQTINSAKHVELSKEQLFQAQLNQAMLLVAVNYYDAVKANKDLIVAQNLFTASQNFYYSEASRVKAGIGNQIDSYTAKSQVDAAQLALNIARGNAATSCTNLVTLIDNANDTSVCGHLVDPVVPGSFDVDVNAAIALGLTSRPEIVANQNLIASAQDQRNGIGGFKNHFSVGAGLTNGSGPNSGIGGVDVMHSGSTTTAGLTASLTWGGTDKGDIEQANSRIDQATTMLTGAQKSIRKDVLLAKASLEQAYANKVTAQTYYDDATNLVNTYQAQVKAGVNTLDSTAYVQDLKNLQAAQQALFEADCNVAEAIAQLETSVGAPYTMNINEFFARSGLLRAKR